MKRWWFGEKKHLDDQKIEQEKEDLKNLRYLMDYGTVEQYELYCRSQKADVTDEEIKALIRAFYQRRAERQQELQTAQSLRKRP